MEDSRQLRERRLDRWITIVSIAVPVVVVILFGVRIPDVAPLGFLPPIYATINGITAVLLLAALWAIKQGKKRLHQQLMTTCIGLSLLFLVMYVAYHMTSDPTPYGGQGWMRYLYFFILISHITLSIGVIPMVLISYVRAWAGNFERHKKIAKITFPMGHPIFLVIFNF